MLVLFFLLFFKGSNKSPQKQLNLSVKIMFSFHFQLRNVKLAELFPQTELPCRTKRNQLKVMKEICYRKKERRKEEVLDS